MLQEWLLLCFKLKLSVCVEAGVKETKVATAQAKDIKVKLLRNI